MIQLETIEAYFQTISQQLKALNYKADARNFYSLDTWEILNETYSLAEPKILMLETPQGAFELDGDNSFDSMPIAFICLQKVADVNDNAERRAALQATKHWAHSIYTRIRRDSRSDTHWLYDLDQAQSGNYNKIANQFGNYYGWRVQIELKVFSDMSFKAADWNE